MKLLKSEVRSLRRFRLTNASNADLSPLFQKGTELVTSTKEHSLQYSTTNVVMRRYLYYKDFKAQRLEIGKMS